jgi:hypothetical protein
MQCQATTGKGTRCTRKAEGGSIYCWQHKNYSGVNYVPTEEKKSPRNRIPREEKKSPVIIPKPVLIVNKEPFVNIDEFKRITSATSPKLREEDAGNYKKSKLSKTIVARGPFTLLLQVGEYEPTMLETELKFEANDYTFEQIVDEIRLFYDRKAVHKDFFDLIRLSDQNEDEMSRELFKQLQDEANNGEDIRLADFMGSSIYIEGLQYEALSNRYYLILGS